MTEEKQAEETYFQLTASKKACIQVNGQLVRNESRWEKIPNEPQDFHRMVGTYADVAKQATRRNDFQTKSGFLDYLYHPEPYVTANKETRA